MDFISLDVIPKETASASQGAAVIALHDGSSHMPFYRTVVFKAFAVILFVSVLCFPQPEWLLVVVQHPIGALALASLVSIALLPEVEWWVVLVSVGVGYILFALTGLIETNLETKRQRQQIQEEAEAVAATQAQQNDSDELLQGTRESMENQVLSRSSHMDMGMHPPAPAMADPVASNQFV